MKIHEVKCWSDEFEAVANGAKTCEFRKDDRGYAVGDRFILREWSNLNWYSGRTAEVVVTHIVRGPEFGVPTGYVAMSVQLTDRAAKLDEANAKLAEAQKEIEHLRKFEVVVHTPDAENTVSVASGYTVLHGHVFPMRSSQAEPDESAHCRICGVSYPGTGITCSDPCLGPTVHPPPRELARKLVEQRSIEITKGKP
jgi:hypothetical protein